MTKLLSSHHPEKVQTTRTDILHAFETKIKKANTHHYAFFKLDNSLIALCFFSKEQDLLDKPFIQGYFYVKQFSPEEVAQFLEGAKLNIATLVENFEDSKSAIMSFLEFWNIEVEIFKDCKTLSFNKAKNVLFWNDVENNVLYLTN